MRQHHYRIKDPIRFFLFILISVLIIAFVGYGFLSTGTADASETATYAQVVIQQNDTLWDIADSYNPDVNDIRGIVHEIYEINDIDANNVRPGDVIFVPIY